MRLMLMPDKPEPPPKKRPRKSFPLRIDPEVFDAIKAWAEQDMRSVNAQIEYLLREAAKKAGRMERG